MGNPIHLYCGRCPARNLGSGSISPDPRGTHRPCAPRCGHAAAASPMSVMNSRRFHCPTASRASHQNDSTSRTAGDPLRCGISIRPMTGVGPNSVVPVMGTTALPPESGRPSAILLCRIRATNRIHAVQANNAHGSGYSITSSARRRKDSGTFSPIALAVVRLMTSSNLVGRKNGRSAGFSPLRMRPT